MKNNKIIFGILFGIFLVATIVLIVVQEINIAIFCSLFTVFIGILLVHNIKIGNNPENIYEATIKDILKTYEVILVEVENLPELSERKIVQTTSFKDLVNIEYEFRKPVYFVHNDYSYDFILMTDEDAYIYIQKKDENQKSILELYLDEKSKQEQNSQKQIDVIDSLENTTVIKVDDNKEFIVSPIRNDNTASSSATNSN